MNYEEFKDFILAKAKENKVIFMNFDNSLSETLLDEFIKQPIEGILYDLNRDKATVLTYIEDPKWVNDFAVNLVITKLKVFYDEHRNK